MYTQYNFRGQWKEKILYCFIEIMMVFLKGNFVYLFTQVFSGNTKNMLKISGETMGAFLILPVSVCIQCGIFMYAGSEYAKSSFHLCMGIMASGLLIYFFIMYMLDYMYCLMKKCHRDRMYAEEIKYKEIYYRQMEKRNEYVQNLKHNMQNRLYGLVHLLEKEDTETFARNLRLYCRELKHADENFYSSNPVVNSLLQIKIGVAKSEGIQVDAFIHIPEKLGLDYGDIGILYGNLLDNAIEACLILDTEKRFIQVENKYVDGKMILTIKNSKAKEKNSDLRTQKADRESHGRGIPSAKRVAERYDGIIEFKDEGEVFCVSTILYGV